MASEEEMMRQMMGFSGFGSLKPSVNVSYQNKLNEAKRVVVGSHLDGGKEGEISDSDDEDLIGPLPPTIDTSKQTGSRTSGQDESDGISHEFMDDDELIGPIPPSMQAIERVDESASSSLKHNDGRDDDDDDDDTDDDDIEEQLPDLTETIPRSHEVSLHHGAKAVAGLSLDPSGSRLASGGHDYEVKFWDFNSMDINLRPFRTLQPCGTHSIQTLQYSSTGDKLLIAAGNAQPLVMDRDGHSVYECKKGDQYIVDMKHTKGHVAMVRSACWDPKSKEKFISCSDDSTIRLWDINQVVKNTNVITLKNAQAKKTGCTFCMFTRDGTLIFGTGQDGSIQAWDTRKMFVNTALKNMTAHPNNEITCLHCNHDGKTLLSRSYDETVKQWDCRNFKRPVGVADNLTCYISGTSCFLSPDEKMIVTGTSAKKKDGSGELVFLERDTLKVLHRLGFGSKSVVSSLWHPKINQLVVGLSDGSVKVLFDPSKSNKGATLCIGKVKLKRFDPTDSLIQPKIITPHSLRMYREKRQDGIKKTKKKNRADPVISHKPAAPLGIFTSTGGRIKEGMSLTEFVVKNIALNKRDDKNPREAILKHAKDAAENPFFITPAYSKTQPDPIFEESESKDEDEEHHVFSSKRKKTE